MTLPVLAQIPDFITVPEDGGEFEDAFVITFLTAMQDPIALEFQGTGGVEFDCVWNTFGGIIPNQILECTPQGALPAGNTVTWTVNPGGTGFTTITGTVIPTSSGTFTIPQGGNGVVISPFPSEGGSYDPELDGPVTFSFSQPMDTSVDPDTAVSFNQGSWSCSWADLATLSCTADGTLAPGDYDYELTGLLTAQAEAVPVFNGSFVVEDGTGTTVTITPFPTSGAAYDPVNDGPVTFSFSEVMDQTVDPQMAVLFTQGSWQCVWADATTVECTPTATLAVGSYTYSLSGFVSLAGDTVSPFFGSFTVSNGGGSGGTPAPDCPVDPMALPFPKTMSVCGEGFFAWDYVYLFSRESETGFTLTGYSDISQESLASLVLMDNQGNVTASVMAQEDGTDLIPGADGSRLLAVHEIVNSNLVAVGVYQLDNALAPVFEQGFVSSSDAVSSGYLADGRIALVEDLNREIQVTVLTPSGSVSWAKRYASAAFGAPPGGGLPGFGGLQRVSLRETSSGLLLDVTQSATSLNGTTLVTKSTNLLTHLSNGGAVQWAKKYTGLDTFIAPMTVSLRSGGFLLQATDTKLSGGNNASVDSILVRLDANGEVVWGNRISGPSLNLWDELADGKLLVGGNYQEQESDLGNSVVAIMNTAGAVETQVELAFLAGNYGFGGVDDNRIRYSLMALDDAGGASEPNTALVGSSSLQLDNWTWIQYFRPVDFASVAPEQTGSGIVFSAYRDSDHSVDLIQLDDALQSSASCTLFTNAEVEVASTTFVTSSASVTVAAETVTAADFTPELRPATIGLEPFTLAELPVCQGNPTDPTPALLVAKQGVPGQVIIEFDSVSGQTYTLERTSQLGSTANWGVVEVIPGTGSRIIRNYDQDANGSYYRVVTTIP